jgi:DNA-binding MarR family transcriptional regulator
LTPVGIVIGAMASSEPPERRPARVGYLIARADRGVRRGVAARIAPHELSLPQYTALSLLRERGGLSNAQLARRIFVTPQSMAAVIASLEERGLIVRTPAAGRVLSTELTAEGRRVLDACDERVDAYEQELLAELSPRQQSALREALAKIARAAEATD